MTHNAHRKCFYVQKIWLHGKGVASRSRIPTDYARVMTQSVPGNHHKLCHDTVSPANQAANLKVQNSQKSDQSIPGEDR